MRSPARDHRRLGFLSVLLQTLGLDCNGELGHAGGILATDFQEGQRPDIFTPSTAILNGGYGMWELTVPGDILGQIDNQRIDS